MGRKEDADRVWTYLQEYFDRQEQEDNPPSLGEPVPFLVKHLGMPPVAVTVALQTLNRERGLAMVAIGSALGRPGANNGIQAVARHQSLLALPTIDTTGKKPRVGAAPRVKPKVQEASTEVLTPEGLAAEVDRLRTVLEARDGVIEDLTRRLNKAKGQATDEKDARIRAQSVADSLQIKVNDRDKQIREQVARITAFEQDFGNSDILQGMVNGLLAQVDEIIEAHSEGSTHA